MLRLIVNKARHHFNLALEHAERGRLVEAIDELHNAIDLDKQFVQAHVVLGTLYAKQNEFDKAREAWRTALQIKPELHKAHTYLERVQVVETSFPALRRARIVAGFMALLVIFFVGYQVWLHREDRTVNRLRAAQVEYESGNYGPAIKHLDYVRRIAPKDSMALAAANALNSALKADMRHEVRMIQQLKLHQEFPAALEAIAQMEAREPDGTTSLALALIREDINHYYRDRIEKTYEDYLSGEVDYAELVDQVREFLEIYPDFPEKKELGAYLSRAQDNEVELQIESIRQEFEEAQDVSAALARLRLIGNQFPGNERYVEGRAKLIDEMLTWMFDQFQVLIDVPDFGAATQLLNEINDLAGEFRDVADVSGPLELAWQVLGDARKTSAFREVEELVRTGDPFIARDMILELWADDELTNAECQLLATYLDELDVRELTEDLEFIREREAAYVSLKIDDDEASRTLETYEALLDSDLSSEDRELVLASAAAAALKHGNRKLAGDLVEELTDVNRKSKLLPKLETLMKRKRKQGDDRS